MLETGAHTAPEQQITILPGAPTLEGCNAIISSSPLLCWRVYNREFIKHSVLSSTVSNCQI